MYSYHDSVMADVYNYINDNINLSEWKGNRDELEEKLNDDLWVEDSVTGNASGSYTFNRNKAREYVLDNMEDLSDATWDLGVSSEEIGDKFIFEDWEWMDVTIRCYYLGQVISEVLDELEEQEVL